MAMKAHGVTHVMVHPNRLAVPDAAKAMEEISHRPDMELVGVSPGAFLYRLKPCRDAGCRAALARAKRRRRIAAIDRGHSLRSIFLIAAVAFQVARGMRCISRSAGSARSAAEPISPSASATLLSTCTFCPGSRAAAIKGSIAEGSRKWPSA